MVEPLTLGAIVAVLAAKALERAGERTVDGGEGVLRRLIEALRDRVSGDGEKAGADALARLEEAPDSPTRRHDLAQALDERAAAAPGFRDELEALVEEARRGGVDVDSLAQLAFGDQNVQSAGLFESQVNVTFGPPPATGRGAQPPQ